MDIQELLMEMNIIYDEFLAEAVKVREVAPLIGKSRSLKDMYTSNMMHDISDEIVGLDLPYIERIDLIFRVYELAPSYSVLMYLTMIYDNLKDACKEVIMARFADYLFLDDEYLSTPVGYSLWCDYFEDPARVEFSFNYIYSRLKKEYPDIKKLIDISGPVPYSMKKQLYESLIDDKEYHSLIYDSITNSIFDVFGKVDSNNALKLIERLDIDRNNETYKEVHKRLANKRGR